MGRLIDADEVNEAIYKSFENIQCYDGTGFDIYTDSKEIIDKIPTVEAIPKDQYEARLKAEREKIAEDVANKMDYMGSCLNEKNIILGVITGKRETLDSLCSTCKSESCISNGTAISKADYNERLKADMAAMLKDIQLEIEESENCGKAFHLGLQMASNIIQQRIDKLKENTDV